MTDTNKMTFSLATNFDPELIDYVKSVDTHGQIRDVFGKLKSDRIGGGRASMVLPSLSKRDLKNYIDKCHRAGLRFNYLLNPMCLNNQDVNPAEHKKILRYIEELCEMGVDALTVNSPYLCQLIKKQFSNIQVTIGLYAYIYSIQHIKYWWELGADELTLHHRLNRNFKHLEDILSYTKDKNISMRLIANNVCLHDCPFQINHGNGLAHASQNGNKSKDLYVDYNLLSCNYNKIKHPSKLLSSEWIRPEDIHLYADICKRIGNNKFSIKLLERTKTTDFLKRVVNAYLSESFDGNLIDILTWPSIRNTKVIHKKRIFFRAITGSFRIKDLKKYVEAFELPAIYIDNKSLDGFIEKFRNSYDCGELVCSDENDMKADKGQECSYCKSWAKKTVKYDSVIINNWINQAEAVSDSLKTSKIFGKN